MNVPPLQRGARSGLRCEAGVRRRRWTETVPLRRSVMTVKVLRGGLQAEHAYTAAFSSMGLSFVSHADR